MRISLKELKKLNRIENRIYSMNPILRKRPVSSPKAQFEGKSGEKLLALQSKFASDDRFKVLY